MDKIKEQLAVVLKHGFWIGCVLSALLAVGAWYHATSTLAAQAQAQKDKIKQKAGDVKKITSDNTPHPNQTSLKGMDELNKLVAQDVRDGWKKVYDLQREVLVWPDEFDPKFHRAVDNLRPIEIVPFPTPQEKEINPDFHRIYRDYILNVVPKLAKTVGTEWKAVRQSTGTSGGASSDFSSQFSSGSFATPSSMSPDMGGGNRRVAEDKSLVHWSLSNQQEIQNSHFGFAGRADPPKTLEILYAQEDLWVLHSLTEIIRNTNKGAEFYHESAIKDIDYIRIGKNAGGVSGQITWVTASAEGAMFSGSNPMGADASGRRSSTGSGPMMMPMTGMPGTGGAAAAVAVDPAQFRYVDGNYKPLDAKKVRDVITNSVVSEADALLAVAKRMPVRMRVVMDQRKLPLLITECANSRLPVEVKQVRVNRPPGSSGGGSSGGSYSFSPMTSSSDSSSLGQFSMPGSGGQRAIAGPDPNNVTVEVFGIIYIYNPPNDAQLGLENLNRTAGNSNPPANLAAK